MALLLRDHPAMTHKYLASTLLAGAALVGAPLAATADPRPVPAQTERGPKAAAADETVSYAEREAQDKDKAVAEFDGGARGIYIGGGALTIALLVVIIILLV